ncbi:MAG: reverse transcriptase-like protein [Candidatus Acidiferrales bacterium]
MKTKSSVPGSARLFADSHSPAPPAGVHIANIDGASRGNPGPASYAVVLRDAQGKIVLELAKNIGRETNNVAEYFALLAALDYATTHNINALRIRSDSELLVRQMQGRYKVKSADLKPLHERAAKLARQLQYFAIEHVRRELNRDADALANVALDSAGVPKFEDRKTLSEPPQPAPRLAPSTTSATADPRQYPSRSIRARFVHGTFVPAEPIDLAEGSEVTLDVRITHKR